MPKQLLTRQEVVELMKSIQGKRTSVEYARELGITKQQLCDIYSGRNNPGEAVLVALGLKREVFYAKAS